MRGSKRSSRRKPPFNRLGFFDFQPYVPLRRSIPRRLRDMEAENARLKGVYIRTSEAVHDRVCCGVVDELVAQMRSLGGGRVYVWYFENYSEHR